MLPKLPVRACIKHFLYILKHIFDWCAVDISLSFWPCSIWTPISCVGHPPRLISLHATPEAEDARHLLSQSSFHESESSWLVSISRIPFPRSDPEICGTERQGPWGHHANEGGCCPGSCSGATTGVLCQWYPWCKLGHYFKLRSYFVPCSSSPPISFS